MGSGDVVTLIVVVVGAVFVLLSVFLPSMMKMRARGGGAAETSEATPAAHDRERAAMERIEQSVLQLEETSRELFGRLDTRARVLIRLIEEAEVKTRRIEELQARAKGTGQ